MENIIPPRRRIGLSSAIGNYFDYQATTPCDPRVVKAMLPYWGVSFGNPHSRNHRYGWEAEKAVEGARSQIAQALQADARDIIFTSGATEANNLALKGSIAALPSTKRHIVTLTTEHKCILNTCRYLKRQGYSVTYVGVQKDGLINLNDLENALTTETGLVSVMAAHNEIGVIQPLAEIGALCRQRGILFHSDAAQAFGKIPLDVEAMNLDMVSLSSHKIYGPAGIGALYVRRKPRVRLQPLIDGGGQERGMRSGTLPTALCVGFGAAASIALATLNKEALRLKKMTSFLLNDVLQHLPHVSINGCLINRLPGNLNLSFAAVEGEGLMMRLKEFALSSGSACTSESLEPSYVLAALGVPDELAHTSLRISLGRFTRFQDVKLLAQRLVSEIKALREISPLWEMMQEGIDLKSIQWAAH